MSQKQINNEVYYLGELFRDQIDLDLYADLKRQIWGHLHLHLWLQLRAPLGAGFNDLLLDSSAWQIRTNLLDLKRLR